MSIGEGMDGMQSMGVVIGGKADNLFFKRTCKFDTNSTPN
jgi:hypothetical protein